MPVTKTVKMLVAEAKEQTKILAQPTRMTGSSQVMPF